MESTVLVEIDSESRLTFATNSSGVVLISQFGNIGFSADEFQYYQCLFKLTDTENIGKLRVGSISLSSILHRADLKYDVIKKLLIVAINSISPKPVRIRKASSSTSLPIIETKDPDIDDNCNANLAIDDYHKIDKWNPDADSTDLDFPSLFLSLHQWLLLCKLILYIQINPGVVPDDSLLETICSIYDNENQTAGGKRTDSSMSTTPPTTSISGRTHINGCLVHERKPLLDSNHVVTTTSASSEDSNIKSTVSTTGHFANFRLGVAVASPYNSLKGARVTGWEVCSEGFHKPHTKFNICLTQSSTDIIDVERREMTVDITAVVSSRSNLAGDDALVVDSNLQEGSDSERAISSEVWVADLPASITPSPVTDPDPDLDQGPCEASTGPVPDLDPAAPLSSSSPPPTVADAGSKKNKKSLKKKSAAAGKKKASETGRGSGVDSHGEPESTGPPPMPPPLLDLASTHIDSSTSQSLKTSPQLPSSLSQSETLVSASLTPEHSTMGGQGPGPGSGVGSVPSGEIRSNQAALSASNDTRAKSPSPGTDTDTDTRGGTVPVLVKGDQKMCAESDTQTREEDQESQRRYSDFEVLVCVLQRLYKGIILPPLPPKTWLTQLQQQTLPSQLFAVQRQAELQLFLSAMLAHPIMRHSFELVMFLRTSRAGLNSFRLTFPLFTFDSSGGVIANYRNKNLVKSGSEFISEATLTAKAAAAGIVSSIWDLGSALLQNNYLSGDRRLRSGSNLSESSINSDRSTDRDRDRDRERGVEEVRWVLGALDPAARSSPLTPDSRKQAADSLKASSESDRPFYHAGKTVGSIGEVRKDKGEAFYNTESRNSSGHYSNSDCSYEEGSERAKGQNSAISAKGRSSAPSAAPGGQTAALPAGTAPRSLGQSSQSSADGEDVPLHSACSVSACICSTPNGRCTSALSASTASVSVSTVVSSCQGDKKGVDVSPSEPLDSPRGSLQQLLKILSAAAAVGDRLDALLNADGNHLYALSQFGYYLKQSSDASAGERGTFHSNTLAFNGAAEKVAKGLQVFLEDQHKQSVTPLQFLGRYLQSTQTVITQRGRATAAVEHSLLEEQHKKKALDIARRTKGVTEDILSKCIEELTAAEESLETCRREEGAVVSVLHSEVASLMDVQRLSVQAHLVSFATSRAAQHAACLEAWEGLREALGDMPMSPCMDSSATWPSVEASGSALIEAFL